MFSMDFLLLMLFMFDTFLLLLRKKFFFKVLFLFSLFPNLERSQSTDQNMQLFKFMCVLLFYYARSLICFVFSNYYISFLFSYVSFSPLSLSLSLSHPLQRDFIHDKLKEKNFTHTHS